MDKLKPCPFCGGEARVFEERGADNNAVLRSMHEVFLQHRHIQQPETGY